MYVIRLFFIWKLIKSTFSTTLESWTFTGQLNNFVTLYGEGGDGLGFI